MDSVEAIKLLYDTDFILFSQTADIKQEIQVRLDEMSELVVAGKKDEVLNYYTEDCAGMVPGCEIFFGREGKSVGIYVRAYPNTCWKMPQKKME